MQEYVHQRLLQLQCHCSLV